MARSVSSACRRIADSGVFQGVILAVIVANAITLGVQTYDLSPRADSALDVLDDVFLGIFVLELAIRIAAYGRRPQDFFRDGWNVFDFVVVAAAFAPGLRGNATLLRIVRLLRVVRLVTVLPDLRVLVRALVRSLPPIGSLAALTLLLMYVYAMVGWILFHEEDPANWGTLGQGMLSAFQMLTLENWPSLLEAGMEIHEWSWVFFVSYVLLASFLVINILIAIIINSMEEVRDAERAQARETARTDAVARAEAGGPALVGLAERLSSLRDAVDDLEHELEASGAEGIRRRSARPTKGGRARG